MTAILETRNDDEIKTVERLRNLFVIARNHRRSRYDTWIRNYRLLNNRAGASGNSWMPAPRDSEIYPGCSSLVAWMTDQEINIDLIPAADPTSQFYPFISHIANDLTDVLYTNWLVEAQDIQVKLALWDMLVYGNGTLKAVWDNQISLGWGNAVSRRVDPWALYVDPHATSFDDAEYIIEARRMSADEIERRFPDTYHRAVAREGSADGLDEKPPLNQDTTRMGKANPGSIPQSGQWPGTSPGQGRWSSPSRRNLYDPLPGSVVYEFWLKENTYTDSPNDPDEEMVEGEWRLVVMCNGAILLDCPSTDLWSAGGHPYDRVVFDDIGEFYGIALVDHLAYPQIYINRLLTAMQQSTELTGNPIFMEPANAGLTRIGIINRPGQRLPLSGPAAMQNKPDWLVPPPMPAMAMELVQFWIDRMENILGLSALQKGQTPTQRNAEGALNMVQEAAFVRVRSALTNLQLALQAQAAKQANLIIDNYNEPRIMAILGADGEMTAKFFASNHFLVPSSQGSVPLKYIIRVEAGANSPTSRSSRMAEADKLFVMGVADDEYVLQRHRVRNAQEMLKRLYEKRAKGMIGSPGARQRAGRAS